MSFELKLEYNQQVRRTGVLVAKYLRDVRRIPQALIDLILKELRNTLRVVPRRSLTLNLPINLQQFALSPLETDSPFRAYFNYGATLPSNSFSTFEYPRRADWAHPTMFDELVTGKRHVTGREEPPQRIVQGPLGLGKYGNRLGYGSFQ